MDTLEEATILKPVGNFTGGRGMGNDEVGRTSYRITELQNYRITELQSYRITELQNYRITELQSYRITELLNDIRRTRRSAERVLIMPNLEDDKHYSHSSAEAVALLRLIQMSEADIKAGRVLSVEQAREAINRSRRERIERAKNQSGESGH
jgi:hypothetical protein